MCGIFAVYDQNIENKEHLLNQAFDLLRHRGPDYKKKIINKNLCLGHHRLSIIDLDARSSQPMSTPDGRYRLIFNGEIYNYLELRKEIKTKDWLTLSDSEVLLCLWEEYGPQALDKIHGMFAFIIFDSLKNELHICRDRFGIKPIYYFKSKDCFIFSSEIKPIIKYVGCSHPNLNTIKSYLVDSLYDHTSNTFFEGVNKVEPGEIIKINLNNFKWSFNKWYNLSSKISKNKLNYNDTKKKLDHLLNKTINLHLNADVNIGLNISGGIDSSILVKGIQKKDIIQTYLNQNFSEFSEIEWIKKLGVIDKTLAIRINSEMALSRLKTVNFSQEEPFGGVTVCGYDFLYEEAQKKNITVLLDGNGLDEMLCGYSKYLKKETINSKSLDGTELQNNKFLNSKFIENNDLLSCKTEDIFGNMAKNSSINDFLYYKVPRSLRFNDKISMKSSKELRVPFLDHELVEFCFSIQDTYLIKNNLGKYILRDLLYDKTQNKELCFSEKRSVQSPQNQWITHEWYDYILEKIFKSSSLFDRNIFNNDKVINYFKSIKGKKLVNSFHIWQWINLELWFKEFID